MSQISVICTSQIEDPSEYVTYLDSLVRLPSVTEVVVPLTAEGISDEEFSAIFFEYVESADPKIVPIVLSEKSSRPQSINQAVATAKNDVVLLLENPVMVDWVDLREVIEAIEDRPRAIVWFTHRVLNSPEYDPHEDLYFRSIPAPDSMSFSAYAVSRRYFLELRGFDEEPSMKGILGPDLLKRHERRGGALLRLKRQSGVVYSSVDSPTFSGSINFNIGEVEKIVNSKASIYRNLINWSVPVELRVPLISVAIATKDRADLVGESISSVLYQSFQDFEIVVVDDGSEDAEAVQEAVYALGDSRIKLLRNAESRGVSHARNRAADATNCLLTAVHDDDDIMLPRRLEWGIEALSETTDASYGSWTNFDHYDGSMRTFITRKDFDNALVAFSGEGPGHSTWTIPTEIIKALRYNETLTSSVDHYFATRAAAAGVKWGHVGKVVYLRRVHDFQLTSQDTARQKSGHTLSKFGNTFLASDTGLAAMREEGGKHTYPAVKGAKDPSKEFSGYLPDHLVRRDVIIDGNVNNALLKIGIPTKMVSLMEDRDLVTGICYTEQGLLKDITFDELVQIRKSGITRWRSVGTIDVKAEQTAESTFLHDTAVVEGEIATVWEKVSAQAVGRLQLILAVLRRDYKNGYLAVVQHPENVPELGAPEYFSDARLRRRLLVRGELGVQVCYTVFGFENYQAAVQALNSRHEHKPTGPAAIFPAVDPESLVKVLSDEREQRLLKNSLDDSGLGRIS